MKKFQKSRRTTRDFSSIPFEDEHSNSTFLQPVPEYKISWAKYDPGKYLREYIGNYGDAQILHLGGQTSIAVADVLDIGNTIRMIKGSQNVSKFAYNATGANLESHLDAQDETIFQKAKETISRGTILTGVAFGKLCLKIAGTALRIGGNLIESYSRVGELITLGLVNVIPGLSRDIKKHEKTHIGYITAHYGLDARGKTPAEIIKDKITNSSNITRTTRFKALGHHLANAGVALQKLSNQTWAPAKPKATSSRGRSSNYDRFV